MAYLTPKLLGTSIVLFSLMLTACSPKTSAQTHLTTPLIGMSIEEAPLKPSEAASETIKNHSNIPLPTQIPSDMDNITQLNHYFSVICSGYVPSFDTTDSLNHEDMIDFLLSYRYNNYRNTPLFTEIDRNTTSLSKEQISSDALHFFGVKNLKHHSTPYYSLVDDHYVIPYADGEGLCIAKVDKVTPITKDLYEISGVHYSTSSGFNGNPDDPIEE